jgi:hypothetical protein
MWYLFSTYLTPKEFVGVWWTFLSDTGLNVVLGICLFGIFAYCICVKR